MLKKSGFTLIELLIVITILGILSVVGLTSYSGLTGKTQDTKRKADVDVIAKAYELKYDNQNYRYRDLEESDFASGKPKDPKTGSDYPVFWDDPEKKTVFRVCAVLSGGSTDTCNGSSPTCYCKDSIRGDISLIAGLPSLAPLTLTSQLASVWTENWDSLQNVQSRWDSVGSPCYSIPQPGILELICQSAGLTSKQYWDKNQAVEVSGKVRAEPATGSSTDAYWGAIAIYQNDGFDTNYGTVATERNVPPFGGDHTPHVVSLTNDGRPRILLNSQAWQWHDFKIVYSADGTYKYYVDGNLKDTATNSLLTANPDIFVLCVSVGEGTGDDGSKAHCQFGPITVKGILASKTTPSSLTAVNVLNNGGFENQLSSWICQGAISGTCDVDTQTKYSGNVSAKVSNTGGGWGWQLSQGNISASYNEQFCLSARVKKQSATDQVSIAIQEGGGSWRQVDLWAVSTTDWQLIRRTVQVGSNWVLPIQVFLRPWNQNNAAWFDEVSLTRGPC